MPFYPSEEQKSMPLTRPVQKRQERTFRQVGFQGLLDLNYARRKVTVLRIITGKYGQVTDRYRTGYPCSLPKNARKACPAVTINLSINKVENGR